MSNKIISTRFSKEYKIKYPFASAGMAFVGSTTDLAIAVCNAGGIGAVGVGPLPPDVVRTLIRKIRKATRQPFNINFITLFVTEDHIKVCAEEKVPIVSFHFGHPSKEIIDQFHDAKIKVWEQVGSVESAQNAVVDNIDVIIAQGIEAGGHNFSTLPTFILLPEILKAVKPPLLLASGGITTGAQVAAALSLGADGVWVGTRLVASNEAFAHADYKARLTTEDGTNTRLTPIFGPELPQFNPMRVIENAVVKKFIGREDEVPTDTSNEPVIGSTIFFEQDFILRRFTNFVPMPTTEGNFEEMPLLAGQGVGLIDDIQPASEIINTMMSEASSILSSFQFKKQEAVYE
jgi:NAD(P)H-dependent flavin oxidoreductase YrpB (nitropropane dioxygenase family)